MQKSFSGISHLRFIPLMTMIELQETMGAESKNVGKLSILGERLNMKTASIKLKFPDN